MGFFKDRFFKKREQKKMPAVPLASIEKKAEEKKVFPKPEDFILRSIDVLPKGYYVVPTGRSFAARNEKLMVIRKQILANLGLSHVEAESVLNLIRIKKASAIAFDTRGFITESAAKNCLNFVKQREIALAKSGDTKHLEMVSFARKCIEHSLAEKQPGVEKTVKNDFNMGLVDVANSTHYVFHPGDNRPSRLLQTNLLAYGVIGEEAHKGIEIILGERYSKFKSLEREKRKGI